MCDSSRHDSLLNVLLVDDSEGFRKQLKWLVAEGECSITEAENGKEAVQAARAGRFDLIIMNLNMPVQNGFSATRMIRKMEKYRHVPILALSTYDSLAAIEAAHQSGCNSYFNKLTDIDLLIKILRTFSRNVSKVY